MSQSQLNISTFEWRGTTRYRCPECPFDGPTPSDVVKHWRSQHQTQEVIPLSATLFDARGDQIQSRPAQPEDFEAAEDFAFGGEYDEDDNPIESE